MRTLDKPTFVFDMVYDLCVSGFREDSHSIGSDPVRNQVMLLAAEYGVHAEDGRLYVLACCVECCGADVEASLKGLYGGQLRRSNSSARYIYDAIIASAPLRKCPICAVGVARTLDHYLPSSVFGHFAVLPLNLVPACRDCNSAKLATTFSDEGDQPLHAYYDDYSQAQWLFSRVEEGEPVTVGFYVAPPEEWGEVAKLRLQSHLKCFDLEQVFITNASDELAVLEDRLKKLAIEAGVESVRDYLHEEAGIQFQNRNNSWQAALYHALAESDWYCSRFCPA